MMAGNFIGAAYDGQKGGVLGTKIKHGIAFAKCVVG